MKKNKFLKWILIIIGLLMLGSWIIPASVYSNGAFSTSGHEPLGILDIFLAPLQFFNWNFVKTQLSTDGTSVLAYSYVSILLVIFTTEIFYSILNKTGAYGKLVEDVTKKFEKNRRVFLIGTSIFFLIFSAIIGVDLLAFILIPFFITIILKLKYSRISAFVATFLATIIGSAVSITSTEITGINNIVYGLKVGDSFILRILLFLLFAVLFIIYLLYKKEPVLEKEEIVVEPIKSKKKSYAPLMMVFVFFFVIFVIGSYNCYYVFGNATITEAYDNLMATTIGSYPIAKNLFGMLEPFGYWSGFTISGLLLLMSAMVCFIYAMSFEDIIECAKEGIKKVAKPAFYVVLSLVPLILLQNMGGRITFLTTIVGFIHDNITSLTVPFVALSTVIYGIFTGDYYVVSTALSNVVLNSYQENLLSLAILTMQLMHGLICIVAPTSFFLVLGLGYLKIPYQKWLSYIWRLVLILFIFTLGCLLLINLV